MTYFKSKTKYKVGKLYHVVAVFDGKTTELYVNGINDFSSDAQHGDILYPDEAIYTLGAIRIPMNSTLTMGGFEKSKYMIMLPS